MARIHTVGTYPCFLLTPSLPLRSMAPERRIDVQKLIPQVLSAMRDRGFSQTAVCARLSISPVYLSLWLRNKQMPESKRNIYTSALNQWFEDATFSITDPASTGTKRHQALQSRHARIPPLHRCLIRLRLPTSRCCCCARKSPRCHIAAHNRQAASANMPCRWRRCQCLAKANLGRGVQGQWQEAQQ